MPETDTAASPLMHMMPGSGEVIGVMGEVVRVLLPSSATNSALALVEIDSPPGGGPPALHTHPPMEVFYVLEGEVEFSQMGSDGPESFVAGPGSVVHVPSGVPHNYKNVGTSNSRMLGLFTTPDMEQFFRDMSAAATDGAGNPIVPPDVPKLMAVMAKHEVALLGGPPPQE